MDDLQQQDWDRQTWLHFKDLAETTIPEVSGIEVSLTNHCLCQSDKVFVIVSKPGNVRVASMLRDCYLRHSWTEFELWSPNDVALPDPSTTETPDNVERHFRESEVLILNRPLTICNRKYLLHSTGTMQHLKH